MITKQEVLKNLPAVDKLLHTEEVKELLSVYGRASVIFCVRKALDLFREQVHKENRLPDRSDIINKAQQLLKMMSEKSLKHVINATGVIIHTNLGRAPFSEVFLKESLDMLKGYNNLEFDLATASRGSRHKHTTEILRFLTGAEDVLVVNNAAAAVLLILHAFAKRKEVIVSRGELIEIGGSFRIPDIMKAADCKMVEVGTTNKTKAKDYHEAITPKTALIFKAHKSNYVIRGFTEEVNLKTLADIGKAHSIPVVYDLGSGLLKHNKHPLLKEEPTVVDALAAGIDLICFSGDKLLGGPQAGIIAGKKELIEKLKKTPLLRALRVCKTTLAMLETACHYHLNEKELTEKCPVYAMLDQKSEYIYKKAKLLMDALLAYGISADIVTNDAYCGGGTTPDASIESFAVVLKTKGTRKEKQLFAETLYLKLLQNDTPLLGLLKKGKLLFDLLTTDEKDIPEVATIINDSIKKISPPHGVL